MLAAAEQILRDDGYSGLTMERVAAESGVAKTTLYRRWPTKAALCMSLYLEVAERELHDPDTGNIADDLKYITRTVVHLQTETVAGAALIGIITEAHVSPGSSGEVLAAFRQRRREITRRIITRAIERGELDANTDVDLLIDALGGATVFRLLQGHAPLTAGSPMRSSISFFRDVRAMSDALDNPLWSSLLGAHASYASGGAELKVYPLEMAPFAAVPSAETVLDDALLDETLGERPFVYFVGTLPRTEAMRFELEPHANIRQMMCTKLKAPPVHAEPQFASSRRATFLRCST